MSIDGSMLSALNTGTDAPITPAAVILALETAHATFVAASAFPAITRALEPYKGLIIPFLEAWKFKVPNLGATRPAGEELADMLKIFAWIADVPDEPASLRQVLVLRSLRHPKSSKPMPWTKIGRRIGSKGSASSIVLTTQALHAHAIRYLVEAQNSL